MLFLKFEMYKSVPTYVLLGAAIDMDEDPPRVMPLYLPNAPLHDNLINEDKTDVLTLEKPY